MDKNAIGTIAILAFLIVGSCIVMMLPEEEEEDESEDGLENKTIEAFLGYQSVAGSNVGTTVTQNVGTAAIQTTLSFY